MIANLKAKDEGIEQLQENGLVPKVMEGKHGDSLHKVHFSISKKRAWLGQPQLIEGLEKMLGE